jgi:rubrerythrin
MEHLIEEAFRVAIVTELNSYRSYKNAALMMPEGCCKDVLDKLAGEELAIIEEISLHCPFPVTKLVEQTEEQQPHCFKPYPKESPERKLYKQLRTALVDKHCSIEKYMIFAASFKEPKVCQVFELTLSMSRKLFDFIVEAYRQADLRLHRPGLNRRKKRTHIKPLSRPKPNEHTEVFISLLDSGRNTLF